MKSSLENLYVDIEAWRVSKVEDDSSDEFTKQSNNSFHRTYLCVTHVCSEKGKDLGLTLNSECPLVSLWVSKCSRQTDKIRFWKETSKIYRLTSRNISLLLFCDDFRNRNKTHTLWGGTKLQYENKGNQNWMQGWHYGKGLIYYRPIFRLTKLAFLSASALKKANFVSRNIGL